MINIITIKGPASYKEKAVLETQQNVNLIYGLNGAGKSTFSEFLRNYRDEKYNECSIEPKINDEEEEILVYNEHYVDEVFYESSKQKGIFSLSKENNAAKKIIDVAIDKRKKILETISKKQQLFPWKEYASPPQRTACQTAHPLPSCSSSSRVPFLHHRTTDRDLLSPSVHPDSVSLCQ